MASRRGVIGTIAGLGLVGAGVAGLGAAGEDNTTRDSNGMVVEGGELGAFRIRVGDCLLGVTPGQFEAAPAVPCAEPHIYEVIGAFNVNADQGAPFPGQAALDRESEACIAGFSGYVGISYYDSVLELSSITPTEGSWQELDDREILCIVSAPGQKLFSGTVRGAMV